MPNDKKRSQNVGCHLKFVSKNIENMVDVFIHRGHIMGCDVAYTWCWMLKIPCQVDAK